MKSSRPLARDALGLGLRVPHYEHALHRHPAPPAQGEQPAVDYFELLSDNYLDVDAPPRRKAAAVGREYPLVLHGVGLNLLGHEPLDDAYIDAIAALAAEHDVAFVSDHLCWSRARAINHHDLLPTPFTEAIVDYAVERAAYVQARLGRPFALENLSSYVAFRQSTLSKWEFYRAVVERADVVYMLDINNVYVSSQNHAFDPLRYLDAIDFSRVAQVHLAGHSVTPDGTIIDTHDRQVVDAVWQLYAHAWKRGGPFPTLIEWDDAVPTFDVMLGELDRARSVRVKPPPSELVALQDRFTEALRVPLRVQQGSFDVDPAAADPELLGWIQDGEPASARQRLAVYQRQYWLRLFSALQTELALSARLIGMFDFNRLAQLYLLDRAPRHHDLARVADGFGAWLDATPAAYARLKQHGVSLPKQALRQAIALDHAWQRAWNAREAPRWQPTGADASGLEQARLVAVPSLTLFEEDWALVELRQALSAERIALPKRLVAPRHWALFRRGDGVAQVRLQPRQAQLYRLCQSMPLDAAITRFEAGASREEKAALPAQVEAWFARSIELGLWSGVTPP